MLQEVERTTGRANKTETNYGSPEWYKGDRSKFGGSKFAAHMGSELHTFENPLKTEDNYGTSNIDANLMNTICQEVTEALQGKQFGAKPAAAFTSTSKPSHFAGNAYNTSKSHSSFPATV